MSLKEFCLQKNLNVGAVKLLQFSLQPDNEECLEFLMRCLEQKEFDYMLRITVCDSFDNTFKLKPEVPNIFENKIVISKVSTENGLFDEYINKLLSHSQMTAFGTVNNKQNSIKVIKDSITEANFYQLVEKIKDFDMNRLVEVTVTYYETVEYAKKLSDFLLICETLYNSVKSKPKNLRN